MQAIQTRWIGPTNFRGSRVRAFSEAFPRGVIVGWDYALGVEGNHDAAARAFIKAKGWHGVWVRGAAPDNKGTVYVCLKRQFSGASGVSREIRTPTPLAVDPLCYLSVSEGES